MIILQWCKTQILCIMFLLYISILFVRDRKLYSCNNKYTVTEKLFNVLLVVSLVAVLFDGITICTINNLEYVPDSVNRPLHLGMFVAYEMYVTVIFLYWVSATIGISKNRIMQCIYILPCLISVILTTVFLPELKWLKGRYTYYSMGKSVYVSFACIIVYFIFTVCVIVCKHRYIPRRKKKILMTTLVFLIIILTLEVVFKESLVSCMAVAMATFSTYINMENPAIKGLEHYQKEMVMGFSTLVENKDDSTGGHIRRSSEYAVLIAKTLRKEEKYRNIITKDYLDNLVQSAPMHDIGKIGIPDAILQKPGKLTDEEYTKMKEHTLIGGKIIKDTFGHLYNGEYENMAYNVAMYHHEKWNGRGYPNGLKEEEIPLCARIMAVADVFDAVSAKRCYRDAMPLEKCYNIIKEGRGKDFQPEIVDAFMNVRQKVEEIYYNENMGTNA